MDTEEIAVYFTVTYQGMHLQGLVTQMLKDFDELIFSSWVSVSVGKATCFIINLQYRSVSYF